MIYERRALQRRLNELRPVLGDVVDHLARRLNTPGNDRVAAMWETAVFHGLAKFGALDSEVVLPTGRRPDVQLTVGELHITVDITAVSDDGLDEQNPFQELMWQIEAIKTKRGLPSGSLDLQVRHKVERSRRGSRRVLRLPNRNALPEFVRTKISPLIRNGTSAKTFPLHIAIESDDAGIDITIDPSLTPRSTGSYAPYSTSRIRDQTLSTMRSKQRLTRSVELKVRKEFSWVMPAAMHCPSHHSTEMQCPLLRSSMSSSGSTAPLISSC